MFDFDELDKRTSLLTESVARAISRRRMLLKAAKGTVTAIAGVALGQLIGVRNAFAACGCNWYGGAGNANCPDVGGCPATGCPAGCSLCTSSDVCRNSQGYYCNYAGGSWVACTGQGTCGNGHRTCTDCKCPNCSYVCTCLSVCICCNCCTPQDVEAEMQRLAVAGHIASGSTVAV